MEFPVPLAPQRERLRVFAPICRVIHPAPAHSDHTASQPARPGIRHAPSLVIPHITSSFRQSLNTYAKNHIVLTNTHTPATDMASIQRASNALRLNAFLFSWRRFRRSLISQYDSILILLSFHFFPYGGGGRPPALPSGAHDQRAKELVYEKQRASRPPPMGRGAHRPHG